MGRKLKITLDSKLMAINEYLDDLNSIDFVAKKYSISPRYLSTLVQKFMALGPEGIMPKPKNQRYSSEFKQQVVLEYLEGTVSLRELVIKYKMRSHTQILSWLKLYNGGNNLKSTGTKGVVAMNKGRKTSYEERIEIVEHCLKNGLDYGLSAEKYNVSYQQIYSWVGKYNARGASGLKDGRGKGKELVDMNEVERLTAENKLLKARVERLVMEAELKKKYSN